MAGESMRSVDAAWLRMDRAVNTADVVAVLRLEGGLALGRLRRLVRRGLLAHRRFRQRIVRGALGRPAWEDDPRFSLARHVVERRLEAGDAALDEYAGAVASEPLDLRHPPWRIHLVRTPRGSAIVVKLHHCLADGYALVAVLLSLADRPRGPGRAPPRAARDPVLPPSPRAALLAAARDPRRAVELAGAGAGLAAALGRMIALPPDPPTPLKRPLRGERRVACSRPLPLAPVRAAAHARGATTNELLGAAAAGALGRWLRESVPGGAPGDLRALVPVNLRRAGTEEALGNEFGLVFLELPVTAPTVEARIARLHARMQALKASADALATYGVLWFLGRLPAALEQLVNAFFTSKASLVLTSVPGPRRALRLAGRRIERLMFWVPHPASLGLGISILTYAGTVVVGVRADAAVVPEPARLVRLFEEELRAAVPELARRGDRRPRAPPRGVGASAHRIHPV